MAQEFEDVELVAVADVDLESARAVAATCGGCAAYDSYLDLLKNEEPDCVLVVTPTYTHKEICVAAAHAGRHVFCEKPMALKLSECDVMIQAAENAGVKLMLGFVRRFQPVFREMNRRIEAGAVGELKLLYAVRLGGRPPFGVGDWRKERSKVGGLVSAFIHEVDLLRWFGGEVASVSALANYGTFPDTDVEDNLVMNFTFENDAVGSLLASQIYPTGAYDLGVAGTKGALRFGGDVNTLVVAPHGGAVETVNLEPNDALREELRHFFDCVRDNREPAITGIDGKKSLEIALAGYRAAERGEIVRLPMG